MIRTADDIAASSEAAWDASKSRKRDFSMIPAASSSSVRKRSAGLQTEKYEERKNLYGAAKRKKYAWGRNPYEAEEDAPLASPYGGGGVRRRRAADDGEGRYTGLRNDDTYTPSSFRDRSADRSWESAYPSSASGWDYVGERQRARS